VDDGIAAVERRPDRVELGDVGHVTGERLRGPGQRDEVVAAGEMLADGGSDRSLRAGDEDALRSGGHPVSSKAA
jgi:hypothetical protein